MVLPGFERRCYFEPYPRAGGGGDDGVRGAAGDAISRQFGGHGAHRTRS